MKLPLPFFEKKEKSEYFLSLVLQHEKASAFIFEKLSGKISIIGQREEDFEDSVESATFEELLDIADRVVSKAEEPIAQDYEVQKTIFGLKNSWILDNKIKKEYLDKLKKIASELGLSPIGFLTNEEAIVNLIQQEEGAPPSAILVEIGRKYITVSLIRAGRIKEAKISEFHESSVFTVDTLLKHLSLEILPSKLYLTSDTDFTQDFIGHQWSKSLPFLHLPQIINLPSNFIAKAFIFGMASKMGAQVQEVMDQLIEGEKEQTQIDERKSEQEIAPKMEYLEKDSAQDLFGFVENQDVTKIEEPKETIEEKPQLEKKMGNKFIDQALIFAATILPIMRRASENILNFVKKTLPRSGILLRRTKLIISLFIPIFLLLSIILFYLFGLKAQVVLNVRPKIEEKQSQVLFSSKVDSSDNIIGSKLVSTSEEGIVARNTTGKKETGDKAKGTVTIFNSTDNTVTFPVRTTLISSNKLEFMTLDKVTVASQSGDVFSPKNPGKANVNAEASEFGTEYNLPSNTKLSIGGNPSVAAKNDNPFSGGTKKEISVFSSQDQEKLEKDLIKKLEDKAKSDINKKIKDLKILPSFTKVSVEKKSFDKKVGDEATKAGLKATVFFETHSFDNNGLLNYSLNLFDQSNSALSKNNLDLEIKDISPKNREEALAKLTVKAKIFPKVNEKETAGKIAGKSFEEARALLLKIPQVENANFSFSPNIKLLPQTLPRISKNIKILIVE